MAEMWRSDSVSSASSSSVRRFGFVRVSKGTATELKAERMPLSCGDEGHM